MILVLSKKFNGSERQAQPHTRPLFVFCPYFKSTFSIQIDCSAWLEPFDRLCLIVMIIICVGPLPVWHHNRQMRRKLRAVRHKNVRPLPLGSHCCFDPHRLCTQADCSHRDGTEVLSHYGCASSGLFYWHVLEEVSGGGDALGQKLVHQTTIFRKYNNEFEPFQSR